MEEIVEKLTKRLLSQFAIIQAETLSKNLSQVGADGIPHRFGHGKRVRIPTEDRRRSAVPINRDPLLRNGVWIEKAQMHGNMSICITLEYREKAFCETTLFVFE
jgi:hypothetical protein